MKWKNQWNDRIRLYSGNSIRMRSRILDLLKLELNINEMKCKKIIKRRNTYRKSYYHITKDDILKNPLSVLNTFNIPKKSGSVRFTLPLLDSKITEKSL